MAKSLRGDDAQNFIDVIDEVCSTIAHLREIWLIDVGMQRINQLGTGWA